MKGIINKGIQDMITATFGAEAWETVKSLANCEEPFFAISSNYPDEQTIALVKAVSEFSGLDMETVLVEYGKFMVPNTLKEQYPAYFKLAGNSAREFLINMDRIHEHATKSISKSAPPKFEYEQLSDGRLLMKYNSNRGLCTVLRGLILGVGILFDEKIDVQEIACVHRGDSQCIMETTFL